MKTRTLLLAVLLTTGGTATLIGSGCASSGVAPTGPDTFMLAKRSAGIGTAGAEVAADLYKEAGEFCTAKGKQVETINVDSKDWAPFVRLANARLDFRCQQVSRSRKNALQGVDAEGLSG